MKMEDVDIDIDFLVEMLKQQGFRCAYSNVPLQFECFGQCDSIFRMSLERKNPRRGYTRDNVCLIAAGFQGCDYTRRRKYRGTGSAGWSKSKVDFVVQWLHEKEHGAESPSQTYEEFLHSRA
jgi:hypothetical protein